MLPQNINISREELLKQDFSIRRINESATTLKSPLADDVNKIKALYETRYPIYTAAADVTVPVRGTPEETANTILEKLK